jgi:tripartite-type tricarboxylate transporter receptor subunit TctC
VRGLVNRARRQPPHPPALRAGPSLSRKGRGIIAALLLCLAALPVAAQEYPARLVTLIVPYTPGTGPDILARTLGQKLQERWGQPVVVENKPGASGNIGTLAVAKSPPDGYTLLITPNTFATAPWLYEKPQFDPIADFAPVGKLAIGRLALIVNPKALDVKNLAELAAAARREPGKLNYASPGSGTPQHLVMELLKQRLGIDIVHVPYKGSAGATTDVLAGHVPMVVIGLHIALQHVAAGQVRIIAVSGRNEESPAERALPTFDEQGVRGIEADLWYGVLAPAKTPADVTAKLNRDFSQAVVEAEVRESLARQGLLPTPTGPEEFATLIRADLDKWRKVIADAGIKAD